jgi:hypothetical protein
MVPLARAKPVRPRSARRNPLIGSLVLLAAVVIIGAAYVTYVLWPRGEEPPLSLDAPSLPIIVAGVSFNIEPAAIRMPLQRRPGTLERVDLAYLWPSLTPPDPALRPNMDAPVDPNERLFVTIAAGGATLPLAERAQTIYPRYLMPEPIAGPDGLNVRRFRDDTPYKGEELVMQTDAPAHFLARCSRKGVTNSGICLLDRRIGNADITLRFPRDWLVHWKKVAAGIDKLMARLHPQN